jgi:hypothetical protein
MQHHCVSRNGNYHSWIFNGHTTIKCILTSFFLRFNQLTPWSRVLPEKLKRPQLFKKFPAFYGTQRFIAVFTRARWRINLIPIPLCVIRNMLKFLRWGVFNTSPNCQTTGPPLVGCPRLFIQYIRSYPPYLQAVPPSATWGRTMPWWQGPTYHRDRDPLITVIGTHLSLWQGPTYHRDWDPLITVIGTHLSLW